MEWRDIAAGTWGHPGVITEPTAFMQYVQAIYSGGGLGIAPIHNGMIITLFKPDIR